MRFNEGVRVCFVCGDVDFGGVKVVEVNRPDDLLGDTRREGDRHTILLAVLGIPGALAAEVGGVRQVTPGLVLKAVPLAEEVVPAVIADLGDRGCITDTWVMCGA